MTLQSRGIRFLDLNADFVTGKSARVERGMDKQVSVREDEDEGQAAFVIETQSGTYLYHKEGGGFSSLLDTDGRDWIGYRAGDGPAGEYRGIPNMVFRGSKRGFFHPGHSGEKGSETILDACGPERVVLETTSGDGLWQVRWEVDACCARMQVVRVDNADPMYWVLYEGTPGGVFRPDESRCIRCTGEETSVAEPWEAILPSPGWVAFTDPERRRSLFLWSERAGDAPTALYPMPPMTVFGFGRRQKGVEATMSEAGATFCVGLVDSAEFNVVKETVETVARGPQTRSGDKGEGNAD